MKFIRIFAVLGAVCLLTAPARAEEATYALDAGRSRIEFTAHSTGHDFEGWTADIKGRMTIDRERVTIAAPIEIVIPVLPLTTGIPARDHAMQHMFRADRFADIRYTVASITPAGEGKYRLDGTLVIAGVPKPLSIDADGVFDGDHVTVTGRVPLTVTDFGLRPPSMLGFMSVRPDITLSFKTVWKRA